MKAVVKIPSKAPARSAGRIAGRKTKDHREGSNRAAQLDPLFVIFEQHLYNFHDADSDRKTFVGNVVAEYLTYLRKKNITVPKSLEQPIVEELGSQVNTMLVKKIYGCLTIEDFQKRLPTSEKRRARNRYTKLG
jgi:hypothetical protein